MLGELVRAETERHRREFTSTVVLLLFGDRKVAFFCLSTAEKKARFGGGPFLVFVLGTFALGNARQ